MRTLLTGSPTAETVATRLDVRSRFLVDRVPLLPRADTRWETRSAWLTTLYLSGKEFAFVTYTSHGWDLYLKVLESYSAYGPWGHDATARLRAVEMAEIYARAWVQVRAQGGSRRAQVKALQSTMLVHAPTPAWLAAKRSPSG